MVVAPAGPTTRIAPTPSGYLHIGNAVNFLVTSWWARAHDARLVLRIDDFDSGRVRREYLEDVFAAIRWLGISVDRGPRDPDEFLSDWSLSHRVRHFQRARDRLRSLHPDAVFVCRCSRTQLDAGRCTAGCRQLHLPFHAGDSAVRLSVRPGEEVRLGGTAVPVPPGDHVLWRRDDLPSYHLGSVVSDEDLGITTVIRGADLLASSALQVHLAGLLPAPGFRSARILHHALLTDPHGQKLSKSAGAGGHPMQRDDATLEQVRASATVLAAPLGITPA